ncbi:sugar-binding protein [Dysgonomonas sp. 520]|uniref:sugar-binding protein n=1 Tax=Dysgonomonas sp. 520 TaxID=2302931 RepID=UPI0013D2E2F9|nr:sugar-binding protein [Dysgonomonas sp. 520]NDW08550.1 T9SS C-terminal target domain-containing protein [Dysgonomonas sp. 520]
MKRKCTFLTLAAMMFCGSASVMAQDPGYFENYKTINVYKTTERITVDGIDNEGIWASTDVKEHSLDRLLDANASNTTGYAATFKAVYDDTFIYLFIKVKDATYIPYDKDQIKGDTNIDNLEMYFSATGLRSSIDNIPAAMDGTSDTQLRISVGNTENRATGVGYAKAMIVDDQISGYEYTTVKTADGYNVEVMLSNDIVIPDTYMDKFAEGQTILFDLEGADCINYADGRKVILGWSGDDYFAWKRNAKYGDMTFKGLASSGIKDTKYSDVKYIYNNGTLQLFDVKDNSKISVCDLSGRLVESAVYNGQNIDLSNLSSGVYAIQIENAGVLKIVK